METSPLSGRGARALPLAHGVGPVFGTKSRLSEPHVPRNELVDLECSSHPCSPELKAHWDPKQWARTGHIPCGPTRRKVKMLRKDAISCPGHLEAFFFSYKVSWGRSVTPHYGPR